MNNWIFDWSNTQETQGGAQMPAGGYVAKILSVKEGVSKKGGRPMLTVTLDVAEGEYKGYASDYEKETGWDYRYLKKYVHLDQKGAGQAKWFFNRIDGFALTDGWHNWTDIEGKLIGVVLREEEYNKTTGGIGTKLSVDSIAYIDDIRKGNFKVREKKTITPAVAPAQQVVSDDELPF